MNSAARQISHKVPINLQGASVTVEFRDALFDAANKAGVSPNEFVLRAPAAKLVERGRSLTGLFGPNDLHEGSL